ncbi:MAG: mechanosensitive ion channel family protein [Acidobacteriota bacterium]|nr:mechanosensitive ion channel family protein [Acidobacteriota bacterium]
MPTSVSSRLVTWLIPLTLIIAVIIAVNVAAPFLIEHTGDFFDEEMSRNMARNSFDTFLRLLKVLLWMSLVIVIVRIFNSIVFTSAFDAQRGKRTSVLIRNIFSITVYLIAFSIIFKSQYPGIDLAAVFTTSAILGVILGLALQDTLGNLFAGLSLQADQPFAVGDVINIPNKGKGVVEMVTWRGLKIRTFQNKLLIISNTNLGRETFEVAPRDNLNARLIFFSTLYTDSPTKTIHVVREAVREAENVSQKIKPIVRIRELGPSGIEWEVKYWLEDYAKHNDTDALVRKLIWYAFLRENINFAYPTQTLYIKRRSRKAKVEDEAYPVFERLSAIEIFEPLNDEETMQLAKETARRVFAPGEVIIRAGEAGDTMFVVNRGIVSIQLADEAGGNGASSKPRVLATLTEGKFFGEMALLTGEPRSATVVAVEETEVFEIGHQSVKKLFENNPYLVEALSRAVAERRALLQSSAERRNEEVERDHAGLFAAVRRFFGMG